jgi:hypothetical protein
MARVIEKTGVEENAAQISKTGFPAPRSFVCSLAY